MYMTICISYKNYHVTLHAVDNNDGDSYRRWMVIHQEAIEICERKSKHRKQSMGKNKLRSLPTSQWRRPCSADRIQQEGDDPNNRFCRLNSRHINSTVRILPTISETGVNESDTVQVAVSNHRHTKYVEQESKGDEEDIV